MQHSLKGPSGAAWAEVVAAEFLLKFFLAVHDAMAALDVSL